MLYHPNSFFLLFDLIIEKEQANNRPVNSVGRFLVKDLMVKFGGETIQHIEEYGLYKNYKDYFECDTNLRQGSSTLNFRKLRVDAGDKSTSDAVEVKAAAIYGTKHVIPLDLEILTKHGVFNMFKLNGNFQIEIKLAPKDDILVTSDNTKAYDYSLTNVQLEYRAIRGRMLYEEWNEAYKIGKQFSFEDVYHERFTFD